MNSEFPMSFPEEPQANSAQPERVSDETRQSPEQPKGTPIQQKKPPKQIPSVTLPLPRRADSMVPPLSEMAQVRGKNVVASATDAYPMSEFASEDEGEFRTSGRRTGKLVVRSLLVLALGGLFVAFGNGYMNSDLPFFANLRSQFGFTERSSDGSLPSTVSPRSDVSAGGAVTSPSAMDGSSSGASTVSSESSSTTSGVVTQAAAVNTGEQTTTESLNSGAVTQTTRPVSTTSSISPAEVEKAVALLLSQTAQSKELEEHLVEILVQSSSPEKVNPLLDALEKRHRAALESLSLLRKKSGDKTLR